MFKSLILLAVFVVAAIAQTTTHRPGHVNPDCPLQNPEIVKKLPGENCCTFYKCDHGLACNYYIEFKCASLYFRL